MTGNLAVIRNLFDGRLQVLSRGTDNALWDLAETAAGGPWSSWLSLNGVITSDPSVTTNGDGRMEVSREAATPRYGISLKSPREGVGANGRLLAEPWRTAPLLYGLTVVPWTRSSRANSTLRSGSSRKWRRVPGTDGYSGVGLPQKPHARRAGSLRPFFHAYPFAHSLSGALVNLNSMASGTNQEST